MSIKGIVFDFNGTMYIDGDKRKPRGFGYRDMQTGEVCSQTTPQNDM